MFVFPFLDIPRDSVIVIYGAGMAGQTYLWELQETQYAKVVCMIDRDSERYADVLAVPVCKPDRLADYDFEYVVIAVQSSYIANDIKIELNEKLGVPSEKIIWNFRDCNIIWPKCAYPPALFAYNIQDIIPAAVMIWGGIGDLIIMKQHVQELAAWDNRIMIDLFVVAHNLDFARTLYSDISSVHMVSAPAERYYQELDNYRLAFRFDPDPTMDRGDESFFLEHSPAVASKLRQFMHIKSSYGAYLLEVPAALHYRRCEKDGLNCYTSYNRYGAFHVADWHVSIPLLPEVKAAYAAIDLPKDYIVLNYGWGYDKDKTNKPSAKVWPFSYYAMLAQMLRQEWPRLGLVQIGMCGTPQIPGCDKYLFGESLEIVKYVLKNAKLHIDCEGGMVHLATQLGTKCLVFFGQTPLYYYGYPVNENVQAGACQDCCWFTNDVSKCYRGLELPECMAAITPEIALEHIRKCLTAVAEEL